MSAASLAVRVLREPTVAARLTEAEWDALVRYARPRSLLPRVGHLLDQAGVPVPAQVQAHLQAARILARGHREEVLREVAWVARALAPLGVPVVLMKGAAYVCADLPPAASRLFSDVDILVPRARLPEVEARLLGQGWATTHLSAYDQRYYRAWMHELPPMVHIHRQTVLDVHHNVLPQTARTRPDATLLLDAAVPVAGVPALRVLSTTDLVLHSMVHLFHNDDLTHALRDLSDVDLILRARGDDVGFWTRLVERAQALQLGRPLHDGLRYAARVLHTPVPEHVVEACRRWAPSSPLQAWMDRLWTQVLEEGSGAAGMALYLRAHWLRMPPLLLARHLVVKGLKLHQAGTPARH